MFAQRSDKPKILQQATQLNPEEKTPVITPSIKNKLLELRSFSLARCLDEALDNADYELLNFLLTYAKPKSGHQSVCPPDLLNKAVKKGDVRSVRIIIEKGHVDPLRWPDNRNAGPLHIAASEGHLNIIKYFVEELKIDLQKPDKELATTYTNMSFDEAKGHLVPCGYHMLSTALRNEHFDVVKYLVEFGKAPLHCESFLVPPLIQAFLDFHEYVDEGHYDQPAQEHVNIIIFLIKHGLEVNPKNSDEPMLEVFRKRTPLAVACEYRRTDIIKCLIEAKADVNQPCGGSLPIDIAFHSNGYKNKDEIPKIQALLEPLTNRAIGEARILEARKAEEKFIKEEDARIAEVEAKEEAAAKASLTEVGYVRPYVHNYELEREQDRASTLLLLKEMNMEPLPEFEDMRVSEALNGTIDFKVSLPFCERVRFLCSTIPDEVWEQHINVSFTAPQKR